MMRTAARAAIAAAALVGTLVAGGGAASAHRAHEHTAAANLPAPFTTLQPLLTKWRGASPSNAAVLEPDVAVQITDAKGKYIASESTVTQGADSATLVHVTQGPKLTTWVVDPTTGKVIDGPINVTGKKKLIVPADAVAKATNGPVTVGCWLYGYPVFQFTFIIEWVSAYAEIASCLPQTGWNMILGQQLWQVDFRRNWDKVGEYEVTGGGPTGFWDHNVDAACYSGGGPWAFKQQAQAIVEVPGTGVYGTGSGFTVGSWNHCNAI